jgi:hypothetical protein
VRGRCLGPAAARQTGTEASRGDVVLLLDDDVVPEHGLVSGHLRHHGTGIRVVVVGATPFLLSGGCGEDDIASRIHAAEYSERARVYLEGSEDPLPHLWGGNLSLRRADALAVGIYSERFTDRYHEDRDFGLRLHHAGLRGIYDPELIAHHHYRRSLKQWLADARARGGAELALHRVHGPVLGPAPTDLYTGDLRAPARALVELVERPSAGRPARRLLELVVRHGGGGGGPPPPHACAAGATGGRPGPAARGATPRSPGRRRATQPIVIGVKPRMSPRTKPGFVLSTASTPTIAPPGHHVGCAASEAGESVTLTTLPLAG